MGSLFVGLSNSANGPFSNVYNQFGETHLAANSPWTQIGIDLTNYIGQNVYASFTYTRLPQANPTYTGDLAIDYLQVITCSSCPSTIGHLQGSPSISSSDDGLAVCE